MRATLKVIATLCSIEALFGCASSPTAMDMKIVPAMQVQHSHGSADGFYALGRYFYGSKRVGEAQKSYQQALLLEPGHAKAGNALAVLYAERGEYVQALVILQGLTKAMPDASHLFSNLGYTYYLNGDYELALASLEKATALDPKNAIAWRNLGSVLEKLRNTGQVHAAPGQAQMLSLASAPHQGAHGAMSHLADNSSSFSTLVAISRTMGEPIDVKLGPTSDIRSSHLQEKGALTEVKATQANVYELRQAGAIATITLAAVSPAVPVPSQTASASVLPAPPRTEGHASRYATRQGAFRLEIINGNGIRGMATSIGRIINRPEMPIVRLANQKPFDVKATRIEYSKGCEQAAHDLARILGRLVPIVPNKNGSVADLRLVLGHDMQDANAIHLHHRKQFEMAGKSSFE